MTVRGELGPYPIGIDVAANMRVYKEYIEHVNEKPLFSIGHL